MKLHKGTVNLVAPAIVLLILAGVGLDNLARPHPSDAEPYHAAVRAAAKELPDRVGEWIGADEPVPPAAFQLLKPNIIYSRRFVNSRLSRSVGVLIVHCKDARDIDGHYPPICYPAHGYEQVSAEPLTWKVEELTIHGTEYKFQVRRGLTSSHLIVDNFILLPNGKVMPDMKAVGKQAADFMTRFHGAGQVQVVFSDPDISDAERAEIFTTMIRAHLPIIRAILAGVSQTAGAHS